MPFLNGSPILFTWVHSVGSFLFRFLFHDTKELSPCHKLWFSNPYIFGNHSCTNLWYFKLILFDLTEVIVWNVKDSKDKGINRKSEFVTKTQFLRERKANERFIFLHFVKLWPWHTKIDPNTMQQPYFGRH